MVDQKAAMATLRGMSEEYPQLKQMLPADGAAPASGTAPSSSAPPRLTPSGNPPSTISPPQK
jgi:hypothetical protein